MKAFKKAKKYDVRGDTENGPLAQKAISLLKKRLKRMCICGTVWTVISIVFLLIGILLLVYFGKYWGDETTKKRVFSYLGLAFILAAVLTTIVFVIIFILLYHMLKYSDRTRNPNNFVEKPYKKYNMGEAPYPQQVYEVNEKIETKQQQSAPEEIQSEAVKVEEIKVDTH